MQSREYSRFKAIKLNEIIDTRNKQRIKQMTLDGINRTTFHHIHLVVMHVHKLIASFTLTLYDFIVFIQMNWENQLTFSINWSFEVDAVEHVVKVYRHLSVTNMIGGVHKGLTC